MTFNGEVKGIYVIVESENKQFLKRHFGDGMGGGNLYDGPWYFSQNLAAADLKDEVEENRSRDDLAALASVVQTSSEADFVADAMPLIDMAQFVRSAAVEVVTCAWDGYVYAAWNYYLYHVPSDDRFVILPHGANWPYWHADLDPFNLYVYPWGESTSPGRLAERMHENAALAAAFRAAVADVAGAPFDVDVLHARLDQIAELVHSAPTGSAREVAGIASHCQARGPQRFEDARHPILRVKGRRRHNGHAR